MLVCAGIMYSYKEGNKDVAKAQGTSAGLKVGGVAAGAAAGAAIGSVVRGCKDIGTDNSR